jgi:hypothetical protein
MLCRRSQAFQPDGESTPHCPAHAKLRIMRARRRFQFTLKSLLRSVFFLSLLLAAWTCLPGVMRDALFAAFAVFSPVLLAVYFADWLDRAP